MQEGSLITPSKSLLKQIPILKNIHGVQFSPKVPEKDEIYMCTGLTAYNDNIEVKVDGLTARSERHNWYFVLSDWDEVQAPEEIDIEEVMMDSIYGTSKQLV